MSKYYVATLSRYVIVDATDQDIARIAGHAALVELCADRPDMPINILTIRLATEGEVDLWNTHQENVASESARLSRLMPG